jgi:hypothetical protein
MPNKHINIQTKNKILILLSILAASTIASAQSLQFCIYNKYGQRQGGCYVDKLTITSFFMSHAVNPVFDV